SASPTCSPTACRACWPTCIAWSAGWRSPPSPPSPRGWRCGRTAGDGARSAIVGVETVVTTRERKPWHAIFRLLERDERVFAVLLAVTMVAGLATLGLVPLQPRQSIDLYSMVVWFALYKLGVFALVTVHPRRTRAIFL